MRCLNCGTEVLAEAQFCPECGTALRVACASCGAANEPRYKFCGQCGHALAAGDARRQSLRFASPQRYTPPHLAERILASRAMFERERKHVTVLFADLKASMEFLADRDPEDARELIDPLLERMIDAVHRYEGTVNQVMGDGIMALFGAPLAHEDHAVRACLAAIRIQEAVRQYADGVQRAHGVPLHVRVGINSGEVVVRSIGSDLQMDYTAVGQTTHLAARMEQMALPGSILATVNTVRLAEGYVKLRPLGPVPIRGLRDAVEVYELIGAMPARTRLEVAAVRGLTPFAGRSGELAQLHAALDRAAEGHGQVVGIVGEPGVGKSRLTYEFARSDRAAGWLVLAGSAPSLGRTAPYRPVTDLLRAYFDVGARDTHADIRDRVVGRLAALDPALEAARPALLALLDLPVEGETWALYEPQERRRRTVDAVKRLLFRISQVQPLILVFEDLHWADSGTQAVLDGLVESVPMAPVLLVGTYRPDYRHAWGARSYYTQLRVDPLPTKTAGELLDLLLAPDARADRLKQMLIESTGGNPFFLEETLRTLVETGALVGERGGYRVASDLGAVQVPVTVQAVLGARIDRLPPEDKRLLQTAAVFGKDVPLTLLQAIDDTPEEALRAGLARLQAAEFLYEARLFPDVEYTFKHVLTQEVAYGSLLHEHRRALHARIVEAIERLAGDRLEEQVDRLAHHALRANLWDKAVSYAHRAGLTASARSASREAVAWVEQALAALEHLPESREKIERAIDLRFDLHSSLIPVGALRRILDTLREAEALAQGLDDRRRLGRVFAYMATCYWWMGEPRRAVESGERALAIAAALEDPTLEALTNQRLGQAYATVAEYRRAIDILTRHIERPRQAPIQGRFGMAGLASATARAWIAWCLGNVGEFAPAIRVASETVRVAEAVGDRYSLAVACAGAGQPHLLQGNLDDAISWFERSAQITRQAGFVPLFLLTASDLGLAYARSGRVAEGLVLLEQVVEQSSRIEVVPTHTRAQMYIADAYLLAGRLAEARKAAGRALDLIRRHDQRFGEPETLKILGDIHAAEDAHAEADTCYREALALAERLEMRPLVARCELARGVLHARAGRRAEAVTTLARAQATLAGLGMSRWADEASAALAAVREPSPAQAGELFEPSRPDFHADPYPFYHRLRAADPVHRTRQGFWVLTRYADVEGALRDSRLGREGPDHMLAAVYGEDPDAKVTRPLVFRDPPAHTRLRGLVSKAFTPRVVEGMRGHIADIVDRLLGRVRDAGEMDVIADLAYPLPVTVICEMLGVPVADHGTITQWSGDIARSLDALGQASDRDIVRRGRLARHALAEYFRGLIPERRRRPTADLLGHLIAVEEQGDQLTEEELLATCVLLFIAGHETTVNLIGNGVLALLRHPEQLEMLRGEPGLLPRAIEELLRYDSPVQRTARIAKTDIELAGKRIPAGALVVVAIGAANRDPERFPEPDRLDIARPDNDHLAFGAGIHFCLGAPLARVEAAVALGALLERMPRLRLAIETPQWRESSTLRGLRALPVSF
jgi:cytochrome P450/class 3 adenylate cyclase/tetratricopeptide (TPR) repeat protein